MSERISRPLFYEGQLLSAADLELGQEYTRGVMARHERYLHTPGVTTGLQLKKDDSTGVVQVLLKPGSVIDAMGRAIVVDREETLSAEDLNAQGVLIPADTDPSVEQEGRPWHPVFLSARDDRVTPVSLSRGCGASSEPTRAEESYTISYGRPGDEGDDPLTVEVTDGPESDLQVRVLVGYVQWDGVNGFFDAKNAPTKDLTVTYAGVRADEVVARGGTLAMRANVGDTREKRPALVLDSDQGGEMRFGLQDARGVVNTVFSVDSTGNLIATGVIKGLKGNTIWADSGTVSDGVLIPLPAGVEKDKVDSGAVALHITVTPRCVSALRPPNKTTGTFIRESFECRVDANRRVFVRDRWFDISNLNTIIVAPSACDYVVLASVVGNTP